MWHVVHTAPHHELQVAKFLGTLGTEAFAPRFPAPRRTRPGSVRDRRLRWLFPNYVLFRPPADFSVWGKVSTGPGVRSLLMSDSTPAMLDDAVVQDIRRRLHDPRGYRRPTPFQPGEAVQITGGPLSELDAIFHRHSNASDRVAILIRLMGRTIEVEVDPDRLRRAG